MVGGVWGSYDVDTIALRVSMGITPGGHIPGFGVESLAAVWKTRDPWAISLSCVIDRMVIFTFYTNSEQTCVHNFKLMSWGFVKVYILKVAYSLVYTVISNILIHWVKSKFYSRNPSLVSIDKKLRNLHITNFQKGTQRIFTLTNALHMRAHSRTRAWWREGALLNMFLPSVTP